MLLKKTLPAPLGFKACVYSVSNQEGRSVEHAKADLICSVLSLTRFAYFVFDLNATPGASAHYYDWFANAMKRVLNDSCSDRSAGEMLRELNNYLVQDEPRGFATAVCALIDGALNQIHFSSAGHQFPILRSTQLLPQAYYFLGADKLGLPLGVVEKIEFEDVDFSLHRGDSLLVASFSYQDRDDKSMQLGFSTENDLETTVNELFGQADVSDANPCILCLQTNP